MTQPTMSRRRFVRAALVAGALALTGGGVAQAYRFDVVRERAALSGLRRPLRLALLSDLHYGPFMRLGSVRAWLDAVHGEAPDLVLYGGDLVDRLASRDVSAFLEELARLEAPLGVFAVLGNHDHLRFPDTRSLREALADVGVEVLHNRGRLVRDDLYLAGVDDLRHGAPDIAAALRDRPSGVASILLSHNPDLLPHVPTDVGLTLCGHTHGGQVRLPWIGSPITSSAYGTRFTMGWVEGPARGYVTRGLGCTTLPLRWNCPAEATVLDCAPAA